MKVHLAKSEDMCGSSDAERRLRTLQLERESWLQQLYELSTQQHTLTASAANADVVIILTMNASTDPLVAKYAEKCFAVDEGDKPEGLLHGIYAAYTRQMPMAWAGRFRTGSYGMYPRTFVNPVVEASAGDAWRGSKRWLASFVGRNSHPCRPHLMAQPVSRDEILLRDSSDFDLFNGVADKRHAQEQFTAILRESKFALCPRGHGASSIRLFEAMQLGVAPVILSDDWILPQGPLWREFALILPERTADIQAALKRHESRYQEMGRRAREAWEQFFAPECYFDYLVAQCVDIGRTQILPERLIRRATPLLRRNNPIDWMLMKAHRLRI